MSKHIRWRLVAVLIVALVSLLAIIPPEDRVRWGLDISGGMNVVLQVETDDIEEELREAAVEETLAVLERRVNGLGVAEAMVTTYSAERHQVLLQLPGVTDPKVLKGILGPPALLELTLVEAGPALTSEALLAEWDGEGPSELKVIRGEVVMDSTGAEPDAVETTYYLVQRTPVVTGRELRTARVTRDELGRPAVGFSLDRQGRAAFATLTAESIGRRLAIMLDGDVISAPVINGRIAGDGQIAGLFSLEEATELAALLRAGALPATLTMLEHGVVSATLGEASVRSGMVASLAGLIAVAAFMVAYYRRLGVMGITAVGLGVLLLVACLVRLDAALTLPGIAGLLLTVGVGVDSNVLIFERIREEQQTGKSMRAAVRASFDRVLLTILDTHVASAVAAVFLFQLGAGAVRGFATTLLLGLVCNVFATVFVTRTLVEWTWSARGFGSRPAPQEA